MTEHEGQAHAHHWEWSYFPLILVAGIFFAVPIGFSLIMVYEMVGAGIGAIGVGVPLIIIGLAGWTKEGIDNAENETGWSLTGLPLFIISEILIFLSFFTSYWLMRLTAPVWPPPGSPEIGIGIPIVMTIILVSSSFTYHLGEGKLEEGDKAGFRTFVMITIALGSLFLALSIYEYAHLIGEGFVFGTNAKSTAFYAITGFHASHVFIGLCTFLAVLIPAMSGKISHVLVTAVGIYWHFVDIVWFFVVSQLYFW